MYSPTAALHHMTIGQPLAQSLFARSAPPLPTDPRMLSYLVTGLTDLGEPPEAVGILTAIITRIGMAHMKTPRTAHDYERPAMKAVRSHLKQNATVVGCLGSTGRFLAVTLPAGDTPLHCSESLDPTSLTLPHSIAYTVAPSKIKASSGKLNDKHTPFTITPQYHPDMKNLWLSEVYSTDKFGVNWRLTYMVTWLYPYLDHMSGAILSDLKHLMRRTLGPESWTYLTPRLSFVPTSPAYPDDGHRTYGASGFALWIYSDSNDDEMEAITEQLTQIFLGNDSTHCATGHIHGVDVLFSAPHPDHPTQPHYIDLNSCLTLPPTPTHWFVEIANLPQALTTHQLHIILRWGFGLPDSEILNIYTEYNMRNSAKSHLRRATPRCVLLVASPDTLCTLLHNQGTIATGLHHLFPEWSKPLVITSRNQTQQGLSPPPPCAAVTFPPLTLTPEQFQHLAHSPDAEPTWQTRRDPRTVSSSPGRTRPSTPPVPSTSPSPSQDRTQAPPKRKYGISARPLADTLTHLALVDPPLQLPELPAALTAIEALCDSSPEAFLQAHTWWTALTARRLALPPPPRELPEPTHPPGLHFPLADDRMETDVETTGGLDSI